MKKYQHYIDALEEVLPTPTQKQRQLLRPLDNLENGSFRNGLLRLYSIIPFEVLQYCSGTRSTLVLTKAQHTKTHVAFPWQ